MDYRDQLKYIKSQRDAEEMVPRRKKKKSQERKRDRREEHSRKTGIIDRFFWNIQLVTSLIFLGAVIILGILPLLYMAVLVLLLLLLLFVVKTKQKRAYRRHERRGSGKGMSLTVSVFLVIMSFYTLKVNGAIDKIATGEENGKYTEEHLMDVTEQPFNIYISGIDVYGDIHKKSRSDVNLIATVNPKTHKILITTTPRDYYVPIPGVSEGKNDKLTHAGLYGVDVSMDTLENLYETEIPFYVRVNFTSVEEIVDVMGGVNVNSELSFTTSKAAGVVMDVKEGKNHFNGKEALAFVRERKHLPGGDDQRGKNQQALLTALIKKAASPMILFRANGMINSVSGNAETNMSEKQIKSLIRMQLSDLKGWDIESVAATGDSSGKQYCYSYKGKALYVTVPNWGSVAKIKDKMNEVMGK